MLKVTNAEGTCDSVDVVAMLHVCRLPGVHCCNGHRSSVATHHQYTGFALPRLALYSVIALTTPHVRAV